MSSQNCMQRRGMCLGHFSSANFWSIVALGLSRVHWCRVALASLAGHGVLGGQFVYPFHLKWCQPVGSHDQWWPSHPFIEFVVWHAAVTDHVQQFLQFKQQALAIESSYHVETFDPLGHDAPNSKNFGTEIFLPRFASMQESHRFFQIHWMAF